MFLCIAHSPSKAQLIAPGQEYTTGNIVQPTNSGGPSSWVNGVYQDNLTCWAWGNPGYCGPNPIVRPGNNINFSFGSTFIYQEQSISSLLPNLGAGLQVTGFNFGFTAKNGNGWDDGRTDQLSAIVRFWDKTGNKGPTNALQSYDYDLNYSFNWTNFNFSETFKSPLSTSSVGSVQYGFVGKDNNYWAGPYGPEITNISFSLKYSVDPCSVNVLSSPSCPGYLEAINSVTPPILVASDPVMTMLTAPTISDGQSPATKTDAGGVEVSSTGTISASDGVPQVVKDSQPQKAEDDKSKSAPNMSLILNTLRQVQANDKAVQESAVQNALQEVSNAITNAQEQTNMVMENIQKINANQQQAAIESQSTSILNIQTQNNQTNKQVIQNFESTQIVNVQPPQITFQQNNMQIKQEEKKTEQINTQTPQATMPKVESPLASISQPTFVEPTMIRQQQKEMQVETPTLQPNLMSFDNPIKTIIEQKPNTENLANERKTETVRTNVQPNEAAGGRDISVIAVVPPGFNSYTNLTLRDVAFYKPDEIYKGQVTVDNVRALRQLSSDRKHQEMVNQQYGK